MQFTMMFFLIITIQAKRKDFKSSNVHKNLENVENLKFDPLIESSELHRDAESRFFKQYTSHLENVKFESPYKLYSDKRRILRRSRDIYTKSEDTKIDKPVGFLSPRDEIVYKGKYRQNALIDQEMQNNLGQNISRMYYDFESILERNLARSFPINQQNPVNSKYGKIAAPETQNPDEVEDFEENTFVLKSMLPVVSNWTTCDEFAKKALFHPADIVNIKWIPFYKWSVRGLSVATVHTFMYPTKKMVQDYKATFGDKVPTIKWNQPKLVMSSDDDMLLIAGDGKGLFYGIHNDEFPLSVKASNMSLPTVRLRLKIVDPYLAMMYCDEQYTLLMAILGEEPMTAADRRNAADVLKFRGVGTPMFRDTTERKKKTQVKKKTDEQNRQFRVEIEHVNAESLMTNL